MSDILSTQDTTLHSKDGDPVDVIDDGSLKRLAVDAKVTGITLSSIVNECNIFLTDVHTIVSKADTIIRTYTVPTAKTFRLVTWQVNVDHPVAIDIMLEVDGVTKVKFYLDPSFGSDHADFNTSPVIFATAGQVVTVKISPTMPRGEINSVITGIEL